MKDVLKIRKLRDLKSGAGLMYDSKDVFCFLFCPYIFNKLYVVIYNTVFTFQSGQSLMCNTF